MGKPRVLVADNSLFMRTMLKNQLESMNCDVIVAPTAKVCDEAMEECRDKQPDIALIDIAIAEYDDFALIRAARECSHPCGVIVMIPDGPAFPELVVCAVRAGASGYIKKPVSPKDLNLRIIGVLKEGER